MYTIAGELRDRNDVATHSHEVVRLVPCNVTK